MARFVREITIVTNDDSRVLNIWQESVGDVGRVVWDRCGPGAHLKHITSCLSCIAYLQKCERQRPGCFRSKHVLELGAGTGACGLAMAALGADVLLTDLPSQLDLLNVNITANTDTAGSARACALCWGEPAPSDTVQNYDYVLAIDCVYYEQSLTPLLSTFEQLCTTPSTRIICFMEIRDVGAPVAIQQQFMRYFTDDRCVLQMRDIEPDELDEDYASPDIKAFIIQRRVF